MVCPHPLVCPVWPVMGQSRCGPRPRASRTGPGGHSDPGSRSQRGTGPCPAPPQQREATHLLALVGRKRVLLSVRQLLVCARQEAGFGKSGGGDTSMPQGGPRVTGPQRLHCCSCHPSPLLRGGSQAAASRVCGERPQGQAPWREGWGEAGGRRPGPHGSWLQGLAHAPGSQLTGQGDGKPNGVHTQNQLPVGRLCQGPPPASPEPCWARLCARVDRAPTRALGPEKVGGCVGGHGRGEVIGRGLCFFLFFP